MRNLIIYTLSAIILFSSCEKDIKYNGEQLEELISISARCYVGSPFSCTIGKTDFFLNKDLDLTLPNAKVEYRVNEVKWLEMTNSSGDYSTYDTPDGYIIQENDTVEIRVSSPGYKTAYSKATAPSNIPILEILDIQNIDVKDSPTKPYDEKLFYEYKVKLRLSGMDKNFVPNSRIIFTCDQQIGVTSHYSDGYNYDQTVYNSNFYSLDPWVIKNSSNNDLEFDLDIFEEDVEPYYSNLIINSPINGYKDFEINIKFLLRVDLEREEVVVDLQKIFFTLQYLSPDCVLFDESINTHLSEDIFSEKTQIYNNIENGVGHFSISANFYLEYNK